MAQRQTKKVLTGVTRAEAEDAFANYNEKTAKLQIIDGEMNGQITAIKEKYEKRIAKLQDEKDEAYDILQSFAEQNPALFDKRKSVEWTHGTFGFRTNTPKLKTLKGFTWASVLQLVKVKLPSYVRTVEEINKELLLANREKIPAEIKSVGVEVVQDETFFVVPKLEETATA